MRQNAPRRTQLLDGAISLLAQQGASGLSYRTLDSHTGLPTGTASNYFRTRTELLVQVTRRIHERLQPDSETAETLQRSQGKAEARAASLEHLLSRVRQDREAYLALLELRLMAQRQTELKEVLLPLLRENLQSSREPGDWRASSPDFMLFYLTMSGLLFEELTMPELLAPLTSEDIVQALLARSGS